MPKKIDKIAVEPDQSRQTIGEFLAYMRSIKKLKLRDVEEATNKEVSNAYLSQLELGKILRPGPHILHLLSRVYGVSYELLMEKAGYFPPRPAGSELRSATAFRPSRVATFAKENLTKDEEEKLLEYLAFLRSRRRKDEKAG
jgi:HTH-type transcriptional regulator, competence development regulator